MPCRVYGATVLASTALIALLAGCRPQPDTRATTPWASVGRAQDPALPARQALARDVYVAGVPLLAHYQALHARYIDRHGPQFLAPLNQLVWHADDAGASDTCLPSAGLDLRAEPVVITVPALAPGRYFSLQLVELDGTALMQIGSRTTGNEGGRYLVAGPDWTGPVPDGISEVIHADTRLLGLGGWLQRWESDTRAHRQRLQAGFQVQPLSRYRGEAAPAAAPPLPPPLPVALARQSPVFFAQLRALLPLAPALPNQADLRRALQQLQVAVATTEALRAGMADGQREIDQRQAALAGRTVGAPQVLDDDPLARAGRAQRGEWIGSSEDALFPQVDTDAEGAPLDGRHHRYTLHFAHGQLPPVHAFWSLSLDASPNAAATVPRAPPLLTSARLAQLHRDPDGGVTLYLQRDPPAPAHRANWVPAPDGPFLAALGYYWPSPALLEARWTLPPIRRTL